ncbi:sensor domain-containing protein [Mycobacteroides abscessus]|uniref:sensor domain-containing protein n=1 Tax=Mycobacteroides abscessus TaxID=36809 RepID=UPI0011A82E22|nr:sensor domain-containing protein [Mycobacteroides abscessus]
MRYGMTLGCAVTTAVLMAGCTQPSEGIKPVAAPSTTTAEMPMTAGTSAPPSVPTTTKAPAPPPLVVTSDKIESILGSRADVGKILGTTLEYDNNDSSPPTDQIGGAPDCAALDIPTASQLGSEWTTYRWNYYRETKDRTAYIVSQVAVLYPTREEAATAFVHAFPKSAAKTCVGAEITKQDQKWTISNIAEISDNTAKWTQLQALQRTPWRCFFDFRNKNNVLFGAYLCQYGDGVPGVTTITDRIAAWIPQ